MVDEKEQSKASISESRLISILCVGGGRGRGKGEGRRKEEGKIG